VRCPDSRAPRIDAHSGPQVPVRQCAAAFPRHWDSPAKPGNRENGAAGESPLELDGNADKSLDILNKEHYMNKFSGFGGRFAAARAGGVPIAANRNGP